MSDTTDELEDMETAMIMLIIDVSIQGNIWLILNERQVLFTVEIYEKKLF